MIFLFQINNLIRILINLYYQDEREAWSLGLGERVREFDQHSLQTCLLEWSVESSHKYLDSGLEWRTTMVSQKGTTLVEAETIPGSQEAERP